MKSTTLAAIGRHFLIGMALILASQGCSDDAIGPGAATTSAAATTGSGAGGSGAGGTGATGGAGGGACLDTSTHQDVFTLEDVGLCVVERYEAPFAVASYAPPTWGRHGGPLTLVQAYAGPDPADEITLMRFAVEGEALTTAETIGPLAVGASTTTPFFASIAIDLGATPFTLVAYADATFAGELIALEGDDVADRWSVHGFYWGISVGDPPRLVHTSQGAVGDEAGATAGLYAADFCAGPVLCPNGATAIDAWGNATGPVAVDQHGNVFAIQIDFVSGTQTLRGFPAEAIAAGQPAIAGADVFTVDGFGSSLAAIAPEGGDAGYVLFQPQFADGLDVISEDVIAARFVIDEGAVSPEPSPEAVISMATPGAEVTLMSDDEGRVWLGVATGPASSTFYVLDRP